MSEGEFKKRVTKSSWNAAPCYAIEREKLEKWIVEARKEYPKVSQKQVPVRGRCVDWKTLCIQMEQKIIEFENFGKKWFGENE